MKKQDILKEIVSKKKEKLILAKEQLPEDQLKARIQGLAPTRLFAQAINKPRQISLIAEIKKQSPSGGLLRGDFNLQQIARDYADVGVQAISVLTEEDFFGGNLSYISEVKNIVSVPVLRKDFIFEAYQVYESRFYGADAILLIADLLAKDKLAELLGIAKEIGLECLVESHTDKEVKKVLSLKTQLVGINNRCLHTLDMDFKTTEQLFPLIPKDKVVVIESGIKSYQDVLFLKILGANAVLIGETFMRADNIKQKVEEIMGW